MYEWALGWFVLPMGRGALCMLPCSVPWPSAGRLTLRVGALVTTLAATRSASQGRALCMLLPHDKAVKREEHSSRILEFFREAPCWLCMKVLAGQSCAASLCWAGCGQMLWQLQIEQGGSSIVMIQSCEMLSTWADFSFCSGVQRHPAGLGILEELK